LASQSFGSYTVTVEGVGGLPGEATFYSERAIRMGGEIPHPAGHRLWRDCYCHVSANPGDGIKLTVDGVVPNTEYDLRIYDMDPAAGASTINSWSPTGNTTGTSANIDLIRNPPPQVVDTPSHYVTLRVKASDTTLEVFGTTVSGFGGVRLNAFELFAVSAGLLGDFNNNSSVDAADYVTWRNNAGTSNTLPNDGGIGGTIGTDHYNLWRANFGKVGSGSSAASTAVPEPSCMTLLFAMAIGAVAVVRRSVPR
jgi:hypothetical protein